MNRQKSFEKCEVSHISDMAPVGQAVVDAIYRHNDEEPPSSPARLRPPRESSVMLSTTGQQLQALVHILDPDLGHDQWKQVAMALSHETRNSEEGFQIFDAWSSKGSKYKGPEETRTVWRSLAIEPDKPITLATLVKMVKDAGQDAQAILMAHRERFKKVSFDASSPPAEPPARPFDGTEAVPLAQYSLTGTSKELEKRRQDEVFVLAEIALLGQATAIYAAPNCGKTLGVISLLCDGIIEGRVSGKQVYYINADDNLRGLIEKVKLAEEFGFHMIGEGYRGFRAQMFLPILESMVEADTAAGSIVIVDTAKRFTDLMSKKEASYFTGLVRRFVSRGGTVIALAHVNKKKTDSGKSVYAGTSDIIDDFDCAYVIELVDDGVNSGRRVVAFENRKARGSVAQVVNFSYLSPDCVNSYRELLDSFCRIDAEAADKAAQEAQRQSDEPLIAIVSAAIEAGPAAKKDLVAQLQLETQISRNSAASLIERYCGDIPGEHLWTFERGERGVHRYRLLTQPIGGNS